MDEDLCFITLPVENTLPGEPINASFLRSVEKVNLQERHLKSAKRSPDPADLYLIAIAKLFCWKQKSCSHRLLSA